MRVIGDVDLIVTPELWGELAKNYPIQMEGTIEKISPARDCEILGPGSTWFGTTPDDPSTQEMIEKAEIIEELPFVNLDHVLYYKQKMGREKDLKDIELVKAWRERFEN